MARFTESCFTLPSGTQLVLRSLAPHDHATYLKFQHHVAEETTHTLQMPGRVASQAALCARWAAALSDDHVESFLGVFDADRLVGMMGLHPEFNDHPWTRHVGLFGMMILREYWGYGLGAHMLQCLDAHAVRCGISRIEARVRVNNERGVALYRRAGFAIEGTRRHAVYIDRQYLDEYFIAKLFNPTKEKP